MDLKFPHHECEIAQARGLEKPFARNWMHTNMLTIEGQKMSKSSGNFVTLFDVFKNYDPLTVRYFIAASHYRSLVDFSESALTSAGISMKRLHQTVRNLREIKADGAKPSGKYFEEFRKRFCQAMDEDWYAIRDVITAEQSQPIGESHLDPIFGLNRGFGGKCLPKEPMALSALSERLGVRYDLLDSLQTDNARLRGVLTGKESDVLTLDD